MEKGETIAYHRNVAKANIKEKFEVRNLYPFMSRCYSIFTYSKSEWKEKAKKYFWPSDFYSVYVEHGKKYEKKALNCYKKNNNCKIATPSLILTKKFSWLGYSPCGIIFENGKPSKLLEIKCPYSGQLILYVKKNIST